MRILPTPRSASTSVRLATVWHIRGFRRNLAALARAVATVWDDMTRDGEMAARLSALSAPAVIDGERDSALLRNLLAQVHTCLVHYLAPEHRDDAHRLVIARDLELARATRPEAMRNCSWSRHTPR